MFTSGLIGFATSFSLILAIGSQNAFILRQGLSGQHTLPLVVFCCLSDTALIIAGVIGFGALVESAPWFPPLMLWLGAGFLLIYGALRFRDVWIDDYRIQEGRQGDTLIKTLAIAAAFTWLNPHVYLDTVVLIGAVSSSFEPGSERFWFGVGAIAGSCTFFTALGFGARLLAPIMKTPFAWRVLDTLIGITMWALAAKLIFGQ